MNPNLVTFPGYVLPTFWAKKKFHAGPASRHASPAWKNEFQKFSSTILVWYLFGKFTLSGVKWWKNYRNRTIFDRFMDVWSCLGVPMTSSGKYGDIRCRRRRRLMKFFFRPSDSLWSGDFSYQNSAPFHVLNSSYRVRVTLTPPVSSTSKKPSGGRVKAFIHCAIFCMQNLFVYTAYQ